MAVALQAGGGALATMPGFTAQGGVCDALPVFPEAQGLQYTPLTPFAGISKQSLREAKGFPEGTACLMVTHEAVMCGRPGAQQGAELELIHDSTSLIQIKQLLPFADWQKKQFHPGVPVEDNNSGVVFCRSKPSSVGDFHVADIVQRLARSTASTRQKMFVGPREVSLKTSVEAVFTAALCSALDVVSSGDPLPLLLLVPGCARDNYRAALSRSIMAANIEPVGFMSIASGLVAFHEQQAKGVGGADASSGMDSDDTSAKLRLVLEFDEMTVNASAVQTSRTISGGKKAFSVRNLACAGTCDVGLSVCDMIAAEEELKALNTEEIEELSDSQKAQLLHKTKARRTWKHVTELAQRRLDSCSGIRVFDPLLLERHRCSSLQDTARTAVQRCMEIAQLTSLSEFSEILVCTGGPEENLSEMFAFVADVLQGCLEQAQDEQPATIDGVPVLSFTAKDAFYGACAILRGGGKISVTESLSASIGVCYRDRLVDGEALTIRGCQADAERIGQHVNWVLTAGRSVPAEETIYVPPAAAAAEYNPNTSADRLHLHATSKLASRQETSTPADAERGYNATCPDHGKCDLIVVQDGLPFSNVVDVLAIVKDPLRVPDEQGEPAAEEDGDDGMEDSGPSEPVDEAQVVADYFDELLREEGGAQQPPEYAKLAKVEVGVCRGLARAHVLERAVKPTTDHMFKWALRVALIAMIVSAGLITAYSRAYMQTEQDKGMRQALIDLYERVNPDKVSLVDQLLAKNVGREADLLRRVKRKYQSVLNDDADSDKWIPWEERKKATRERLSEYRTKFYTPNKEADAKPPTTAPPKRSSSI